MTTILASEKCVSASSEGQSTEKLFLFSHSVPFHLQQSSVCAVQDSILCKWWHSKQGKILDRFIFGPLTPNQKVIFISFELINEYLVNHAITSGSDLLGYTDWTEAASSYSHQIEFSDYQVLQVLQAKGGSLRESVWMFCFGKPSGAQTSKMGFLTV